MNTLIPSVLAVQFWQWHEGGHMSMYWGWWVVWAILLIVLAWIAFVPGARRGDKSSSEDVSPEEILKRRFARGEIGEEEFERRMKKLRGSDGGD
jgi:putative membrane protein